MKRILLDLDGTLARFNVRNAMERFDKEIGLPQWKNPEELDLGNFELWSGLALRLCN